MRALNSLAAKMSEKWEMLHFPLRERRQASLDDNNSNYMTRDGPAGARVALIRDSRGVQLPEVTNTAASISCLSVPADFTDETSGSGWPNP